MIHRDVVPGGGTHSAQLEQAERFVREGVVSSASAVAGIAQGIQEGRFAIEELTPQLLELIEKNHPEAIVRPDVVVNA